jgi:Rieske Fe-S protein
VLLTVLSACGPRAAKPTLAQAPFDVGRVEDYAPLSAIRFPGHGVVVVRDDVGVMALSAICTHQACLLDLESEFLSCRCHGSTFAMDGAVLAGPAKEALPHLAIAVVDGRLRVDPQTVVAATERLRL